MKKIIIFFFVFISCGKKTEKIIEIPEEIFEIEDKFEFVEIKEKKSYPHTEGRYIKDENGRVLILHGVNLSNSNKSPPYLPLWLGKDDFKRIKEGGFNVVRFLIEWEAIEPEAQKFNIEYLEQVKERVKWAEEEEIFIILDMHQDVYSKKYGGNGAPLWATIDDGEKFEPQKRWYENYLQPAVKKAFDNFYNNKNGILDHFIKTWLKVVEIFKDEKIVIGYEILNEPFIGSYSAFEIDKFDKEVLTPFYKKVISAIREVDKKKIIFFEPNITIGGGLPSYIEKLPYGDIVYAPHYYDPTVMWEYPYDGKEIRAEEGFKLNEEKALELGVPWFLGEWGIGVHVEGAAEYVLDQMKLIERFMICDTYWNYDREDGKWGMGIIDKEDDKRWVFGILSRPYPQKIAGAPISYKYDDETQNFSFSFKANPEISAPTQIFIPAKMHYPYGFNFQHNVKDHEIETKWDENEQKLSIYFKGKDEKEISINIVPKNPPEIKFGISTHLSLDNEGARMQELSFTKNAGIEFLRRDFLWQIIEPEENNFNFEEYKNLVSDVKKNGQEIIPILDYGVDWAYKEKGNDSTLNPSAFGKFAGSVALNFKNDINFYEIWNEENLSIFFKPVPDPVVYGNLLKSGCKEIKKSCPKCKVLFGGLAATDFIYDKQWSFFEKVMKEHPDIGEYFDIFSIHPYTLIQQFPPEEETIAGSVSKMIQDAKLILGNYGVGGKPLWITEIGWPSCPCPPKNCPPPPQPNVSYEDQAKFLVRSFLLSFSEGVENVFWYTFTDSGGCAFPDKENFFGLVEFDNDPKKPPPPKEKPSFIAYKTMTKFLNGKRFLKIIDTEKKNVYALIFEGINESALILWKWDGEEKIKIEFQEMKFYDISGKEMNVPLENGFYILKIGESPIYGIGKNIKDLKIM